MEQMMANNPAMAQMMQQMAAANGMPMPNAPGAAGAAGAGQA